MNDTILSRWRHRMGYTQRQAAESLGVAWRTYQSMEGEKDKTTGAPMRPNLRTRLAAAAREAGIEPLPESNDE